MRAVEFRRELRIHGSEGNGSAGFVEFRFRPPQMFQQGMHALWAQHNKTNRDP